MAVLKAAERNALPSSTFAGPHRSFPIPDANHARAALSMAHYAADPAEIRAAVHKKFPGIGDKKAAVHQKIHDALAAGGPKSS